MGLEGFSLYLFLSVLKKTRGKKDLFIIGELFLLQFSSVFALLFILFIIGENLLRFSESLFLIS